MEMINILSLFVLAFAVSMDSFMVAFGYGLKQLQLSRQTMIIIGCCSGIVFALAMSIGELIALVVTEQFTNYLGAFLLVGLGIYSVYTFDRPVQKAERTMRYRFELEKLGLVIEILKKPILADLDRSGHISGMEALFLGLALSLDASAAGIGAALTGTSWLAAGLITLMTILFLRLGLYVGCKCSSVVMPNQIRYLPGLLLILLGLSRLFF
ncbi:sporulation membrane protein YtaF [Amphibacillus sediminis]|uniref:sporulation membrane protein YtaF n=1 Tax=Amphibacillus sediminis TaxID=360185 RepID=UPI000A938D32|nr:sporulation membrane protein YtaF [Amphibacillus sediminis]